MGHEGCAGARKWLTCALDALVVITENPLRLLLGFASIFFDFLRRAIVKLSNDPSLSSLPLLSTFLKSYSRPYLGITPPAATKQISASSEPGTLSSATTAEANASNAANGNANGSFPELQKEEDELVEKDVRDRFKKMCEGYFDSVCKKLVIEHNVSLWMMRRVGWTRMSLV